MGWGAEGIVPPPPPPVSGLKVFRFAPWALRSVLPRMVFYLGLGWDETNEGELRKSQGHSMDCNLPTLSSVEREKG